MQVELPPIWLYRGAYLQHKTTSKVGWVSCTHWGEGRLETLDLLIEGDSKLTLSLAEVLEQFEPTGKRSIYPPLWALPGVAENREVGV